MSESKDHSPGKTEFVPEADPTCHEKKLKGSRMIHQLKTSRFGQSRSDLINVVRQTMEKMLSELSAGDKLQERLAKALSLVDLSLKLSPGYKTTAATDFFRLQNEIVKAVWLLCKVRFPELKRLHLFLDPEAEGGDQVAK